MSIFVSIASYRDPELTKTIKSAIENASKPSDLYFSIVIQDFDEDIPDLSWVQNLSLITMHPKDARGAGYARAIAMKAYFDQDYYLQIDSHVIFEKNWDLMCIDEHNKAKTISNNNKIILSYFPPGYHVEPNGEIYFIKNDKRKPPYPTRQKPLLTKRSEWTAQRVEFSDKKKEYPEQSSTVLAGFIFANGSIAKEVPYDPEISFFGEELCFALRAWTRGWDIYSPSKVILHHFYERSGYNKIWSDKNIRDITWHDIEKISKQKQLRVLTGQEQGIYGPGNYRHLKSFEKFIGINFRSMYGLTDSTNEDTI